MKLPNQPIPLSGKTHWLKLVLGAGALLQAGGCMLDAQTSLAQLVTLVGTNLISDFVLGALNVPF